jgi:tripartite-type tricarboxylate transporter receptor subunit TctC
MLGASGINGANVLANVAPKDGSTIGMFAHTVPLDPLIGEGAAKFDPSKFNWLGNMEESVGVCAIWHEAGIAKFEDLKSKEVLFGATATTGPPSQMAAAIKNLLGAKAKVIHGYKGVPGVKLAIEKGEVGGVCGIPMSTLESQWPDLLSTGKVKPVIQLSGAKGAVAGVPYVYDLAASDDDMRVFDLIFGILKLGKLVAAPPGVPADRMTALRTAFKATMKDPQFLADAARQKIDITPTTAEDVAAFITRIYETPKSAVERARVAIKSN